MNFIFKSKVPNHQQIKEKLLYQINLIPTNPYMKEDSGENILHTDWNLPREMHREYAPLFLETIKPHMLSITEALMVKRYEIGYFWFQRYGSQGTHPWHTHANTNLASVYFLECPKGSSTKFKHFTEECEEGDILSFPAFLPHMSPPIDDNSIKTVIAFNASFHH